MPPTTPFNRPLRMVVLISGGGTTLVNLVAEIQADRLDAEIPLVIASRSTCGGIERAQAAELSCEVILRKTFSSTEEFSKEIFARCRDVEADLVICGGFLALLTIPVDFQLRVMNIHPSLVPAFAGQGFHGHRVHESVLERGCRVSGCTVHFVDNEYDHGPILSQAVVPVLDDDTPDTPDTLAARIFAEECRIYPEAIRLFAAGELRVDGRRVKRLDDTPPI